MKTGCRGEILLKKAGRRLIRCEKCGFIHIYPLYSEQDLEFFYKNLYAESTPSYLWYEKVYNVEKWKNPGSVLDVGCWEGIQLEAFLKKGWQCTGLELNNRAASKAARKGIKVYYVSLNDFFTKFKDGKWDVINIAYVLEHVTHPLEILRRLKNHLKEKGIIIIEVPNEFSPLQLAYLKEYRLSPYWIALPDHINYFDKQGLQHLVKCAGLKIIHGETSFPMEMFLLMGDNYLKNKELGRKSFKKVVQMERILRKYDSGLLSQLYEALYNSAIGRSLIVYAQKK